MTSENRSGTGNATSIFVFITALCVMWTNPRFNLEFVHKDTVLCTAQFLIPLSYFLKSSAAAMSSAPAAMTSAPAAMNLNAAGMTHNLCLTPVWFMSGFFISLSKINTILI
jgi:hypothetical protein